MTSNFKINDNMTMTGDNQTVGTVGNKNADTLVFDIPEKYVKYSAKAVINNTCGSFLCQLIDGTLVLKKELTTDEVFNLHIEFTDGDGNIIAKTAELMLYLYSSLDDSGENITTIVREEQKESDKNKLIATLSPIWGDKIQYDTYNYDNVVNIVGEQLIQYKDKQSEQTKIVTDFTVENTKNDKPVVTSSEVEVYSKEYVEAEEKSFDAVVAMKDKMIENLKNTNTSLHMYVEVMENMPTVPNILTIDNQITEPYAVPFLDTHGCTSKLTTISPYITSFGMNVVNCAPTFLCSIHSQIDTIFQNANLLENVMLTGCESQTKYYMLFLNRNKLKNVSLYGFNKNHNVTNVGFMFSNATSLKTVDGEPLDFTGITNAANMFNACANLVNIGFVPNTISTNLQLRESVFLSQESMLSIINGLNASVGHILSLNVITSNYCDNIWFAKYSEENNYYICDKNDEGAESFSTIITDAKNWSIG